MYWFRGLRFKLLILVILPSFVLLAISTESFLVARRLKATIENDNRVQLPLARHTDRMVKELNAIVRYYGSVALSGHDAEARKSDINRTRQAIAAFEVARKSYEALPHRDASAKIYKDVPSDWSSAKEFTEAGLQLFESNDKDDDERAMRMLAMQVAPAFAQVELAMTELEQWRQKADEERIHQATGSADQSILTMILGAAAAVGGILLFGLWLANRLSRTFGNAAGGLAGSVAQVDTAANQLSGASETLSAGAAQAAASLEQTLASLEQLSGMVRKNAESAKQAGSLSASGKSSAEKGEVEVRALGDAMKKIKDSSKKIEEITSVIDELAFQTNLLALNAAVEAARAGEQGKGFAVVAEAVRSLAQRSGEAAKNINSLIKESVSRVDDGERIAERSGEVLHEIVGSVNKIADLNLEISVASDEQAAGIAQISKAMQQIEGATQINAASAEEMSLSSQQLAGEARVLSELVVVLSNEIEGSRRERSVLKQDGKKTRNATARSAKTLDFSRKAHAPKRGAEQIIPFSEQDPKSGAENKVGNVKGF